MNTVYFQPKGIRPKYCEEGMISETDPEHIWYLDEPCKILISDVKIIPKEKVTYNKKQGQYIVKDAYVVSSKRDETLELLQERINKASEYYAHNYFDMHETNSYKELKRGFEAGVEWAINYIHSCESDSDNYVAR